MKRIIIAAFVCLCAIAAFAWFTSCNNGGGEEGPTTDAHIPNQAMLSDTVFFHNTVTGRDYVAIVTLLDSTTRCDCVTFNFQLDQ